jgi:leucyl-tRNA synthetase
MTRTIHRAIAAVTGDLEQFRFNRAVAHVRELTNALDAFDCDEPGHDWVRRFGFDTTVQLIGPMMPHIAEELWQRLGHERMLVETDWPIAEKAFLIDETVTIAVQVKGKLRGTIEMPRDAENAVVEQAALALESVERAMGGSAPRRVIIVTNKIVNVVV